MPLLASLSAFGQNGNLLKVNSFNDIFNNNISSLTDLQIDYLKKSYSAKIEAPKELINGKEYESYYTRSIIKPLLFPNKERTASVITKTRRYNNLTLQYDIFLDEVIYTDTSRTFNYRFPQIALNNNFIDGFNLYFEDDSLTFKYFRLPEYSDRNLKEGYYEVAYQGKSQYLIKHESSFYEREGLNNYKYSPKNYIRTEGIFYKIKNVRDLLSLFGEKAGVVSEFLQSSGIRGRKADKTQIVNVLKFYDSLVTSR